MRLFDKPRVSIHFVLDETGSMSVRKEATISAFNEYVNGLREKYEDRDIIFTLRKFDSERNILVQNGVRLNEVIKLNNENYRPGSLTPLYDAIGKSIAEEENKKGKHLFIILTDGEENASTEYTLKMIKRKIKKLEKKGWKFIFLGVGKEDYVNNVMKGGRSLGFSAGSYLTITDNRIHLIADSCIDRGEDFI